MSLCSSVVEHWSRKPGVLSSILSGGKHFFAFFSLFLKIYSSCILHHLFSAIKKYFFLSKWYFACITGIKQINVAIERSFYIHHTFTSDQRGKKHVFPKQLNS